MGYNTSMLSYLNILPADKGPFSITQAASASGVSVTVAGSLLSCAGRCYFPG